MIKLRRSIGVAAFAATLFLVGGVGAWRSFREAPVAAATTSADALVAPVAGASLEQTIADLQTRLQAQPDDARSLALLGLAYAQEATHTADPSYYPKAEEALQRSLELQPDGNVEALVGMGVVALARHDFAGGVRLGPSRPAGQPGRRAHPRRHRRRAARTRPLPTSVRDVSHDGVDAARRCLVRACVLRARARG